MTTPPPSMVLVMCGFVDRYDVFHNGTQECLHSGTIVRDLGGLTYRRAFRQSL
jgi:hypothetical protein